MLVAGVILLAVIKQFDSARYWRLLLIVPFYFGAIGVFQAWEKT
jgi:hypothetical protein